MTSGLRGGGGAVQGAGRLGQARSTSAFSKLSLEALSPAPEGWGRKAASPEPWREGRDTLATGWRGVWEAKD